ncbi:MAG: sialidase family protein [Cyanobacteriota bacterium]
MTTSTTSQTNDGDPDAQIAAQGTDVEILPDVYIDARWWGYTIVMNQPAALCMDKVLDELEKELLRHFHGETAAAIKALVFLKKTRIEGVADRTKDGCQLVSPWILPFALAVCRNNSGGDQNLWCTVWDPDQRKWGEQAEFNDAQSYSGPALAQHGDLLYCVHRGSSDDESLYWNVYSTNNGWSDDQKFTNATNRKTATTPSLVEFKNKLYCFYRGPGDDEALYSSSFDTATKTWSAGHIIMTGSDKHSSPTGCGVAVYKENELHMIYQANDRTRTLWHLYTTDGNTWHVKFHLTGFSTSDTPALVQYGNNLLMVHRGEKDEHLYYNFYNGSSWGDDESKIPDASGSGFATSTQGPGLAVFDGKVYMVHRSGQASGELWYSVYDGTSWGHDTHIDGQSTGETPALATYKDPQCTPENYVDTNTAVPRLICVHRGWGKNI